MPTETFTAPSSPTRTDLRLVEFSKPPVSEIIASETRLLAESNDETIADELLWQEMQSLATELRVDAQQFEAASQELNRLKEHHPESYRHSLRVTIGAVEAAKWISTIFYAEQKCTKAEADQLVKDAFIAGLVHDAGKALVPLSVLDKPGRYDEQDWKAMRRHSADGYEIIHQNPVFPENIARAVGGHHLRQGENSYGVPDDGLELLDKALIDILATSDPLDANLRNDGNTTSRDAILGQIDRILNQEHYPRTFDTRAVAEDIRRAISGARSEVRDRIEQAQDFVDLLEVDRQQVVNFTQLRDHQSRVAVEIKRAA